MIRFRGGYPRDRRVRRRSGFVGFCRLLLAVRFAKDSLDQALALGLSRGPKLTIPVDLEIPCALDPCLLAASVGAQRAFGPDHEVTVFTDLQRTSAMVDSKLSRGVDRNDVQQIGRASCRERV